MIGNMLRTRLTDCESLKRFLYFYLSLFFLNANITHMRNHMILLTVRKNNGMHHNYISKTLVKVGKQFSFLEIHLLLLSFNSLISHA